MSFTARGMADTMRLDEPNPPQEPPKRTKKRGVIKSYRFCRLKRETVAFTQCHDCPHKELGECKNPDLMKNYHPFAIHVRWARGRGFKKVS
jgi:hypothetical protein